MSTHQSEFLRTVEQRGFVHQGTDLAGLDAKLLDAERSGTPLTGYIGFDATADSLHVGSLLPIMLLRWLQNTGHRPLVLMGGGTTKIGDPSGKDEARQLLTADQIDRNIAGIGRIFARFLRFGDHKAAGDAAMVNNADWLDRLHYIDFLREIGRHFTINRMLTFDSVRLRLDREQPLTFLEFNYMILQAYDFAELARRENCVLQMGGSDQWGNIVSGIDLGRRLGGPELFGLTAPLLTTASGAKMGKTADGAVWLNADRLSPYDYYQYWRNADDADVGRFLKLFTELPLDEIARLEALGGAEINEAKKVLAFEATRLCHGKDAAEAAMATAQSTFAGAGVSDGLPSVTISESELHDGIALIKALQLVGFASSKGEARRLIRGGGARVNDIKVDQEDHDLGPADLTPERYVKLSAGKKRHALLKLS